MVLFIWCDNITCDMTSGTCRNSLFYTTVKRLGALKLLRLSNAIHLVSPVVAAASVRIKRNGPERIAKRDFPCGRGHPFILLFLEHARLLILSDILGLF